MKEYKFVSRVNTEQGPKYTYESDRFVIELFLDTKEFRTTSIPLKLIDPTKATVARELQYSEYYKLKRDLGIDE